MVWVFRYCWDGVSLFCIVNLYGRKLDVSVKMYDPKTNETLETNNNYQMQEPYCMDLYYDLANEKYFNMTHEMLTYVQEDIAELINTRSHICVEFENDYVWLDGDIRCYVITTYMIWA